MLDSIPALTVLLETFRPCMTAPTYQNFCLLLAGSVLAAPFFWRKRGNVEENTLDMIAGRGFLHSEAELCTSKSCAKVLTPSASLAGLTAIVTGARP
jgi:hypothetical protein